MRAIFLGGLVIYAGLAACSAPDKQVTVKCGATNVIMTGALANEIKLATGELEFSKEVCKVVKDVDTSTYTQPTAVAVEMANGKSYQVMLQAAQS